MPTFEDGGVETDKTFTLALDSGDSANGTILDDDGQPSPPPSGNADMAIGKAKNADPVRVGHELRYTVAVHNFGPAFQNVSVFDDLPGNVQFVSAFPSQGVCP